MKGSFVCPIGRLSYVLHDNGIIIFEGKNLRFNSQIFSFKARIPEDKKCYVFSLTPKGDPAKFQLQTCKDILEEDIPKAWERYKTKHPSVQFVSKRQSEEKNRNTSLAHLADLVTKMETILEQVKFEINQLKGNK